MFLSRELTTDLQPEWRFEAESMGKSGPFLAISWSVTCCCSNPASIIPETYPGVGRSRKTDLKLLCLTGLAEAVLSSGASMLRLVCEKIDGTAGGSAVHVYGQDRDLTPLYVVVAMIGAS